MTLFQIFPEDFRMTLNDSYPSPRPEAMAALRDLAFPRVMSSAKGPRTTAILTTILTISSRRSLHGGAVVGDMLYWETPGFRYIEHFGILPALRGQRYGSRVAVRCFPLDRPCFWK